MAHRHDLAGADGASQCAEPGPLVHQCAALLEQVAAAIGGFDLALDRVRSAISITSREWLSARRPSRGRSSGNRER